MFNVNFVFSILNGGSRIQYSEEKVKQEALYLLIKSWNENILILIKEEFRSY